MTTTRDTLFTIQTPHPADSLSILTGDVSGHDKTLLACGTYRLIESTPQRRIGTVLVYEVEEDAAKPRLRELATSDGVGVLDLKWSHGLHDGKPVLVTADAEGRLGLYNYDVSESRLLPVDALTCSSSSLALSFSLHPDLQYHKAFPETLVSLSNGQLAHLVPNESSMVLQETWGAHAYEAWVVSWHSQGDLAFSGSDDLTLKGWDLRAGTESPTFVNRKFEAGITSIAPSPWEPNQVAVGSYDSLAQVFDIRSPYKPLQSCSVSGGAWRLSWHTSPQRRNQVLVAAMHGGAEIVDLENDDATLRSKFVGHESMCYGAEWVTGTGNAGADLVASCSFYDQKIFLWKG